MKNRKTFLLAVVSLMLCFVLFAGNASAAFAENAFGIIGSVETYEAKANTQEQTATLNAASLTFEGKIAINYKLTNLEEGWTAKLSFEQEDGTFILVKTIPVNSAIWRESEQRYVISYADVAAKEMMNRLRIEIFDGTGNRVRLQIGAGKDDYRDSFDYTVATWANNKIDKKNGTGNTKK